METPNTSSSIVPAMSSEISSPTSEPQAATERQTSKAYHRPVLRDEGSISHLTNGIIDEPLY